MLRLQPSASVGKKMPPQRGGNFPTFQLYFQLLSLLQQNVNIWLIVLRDATQFAAGNGYAIDRSVAGVHDHYAVRVRAAVSGSRTPRVEGLCPAEGPFATPVCSSVEG